MSKELKVEKGYYYRLRGYHSCTKSGVTEMVEVQLTVSILANPNVKSISIKII